ncbi:EAL domain-containing response regulator [Burkholderia plantarii]|uniref:EAL domain-containing response regulator n=1 Tax=Burkholderia plantarii TaxID=41899 RepID=UPI0018DB7ABA|nr:EAL domain-containing response regulator [Burkholderia plantarii]MBI0328467.1 EAL domain-containing response regulator [Burkholderia plantarii]
MDDDEVQRRMLQAMLGKLGRPCLAAAGLSEARARLAEACVTTVLLDLRLDGEAGLDLLGSLGEASRSCSLVLMSGCDARTRAATVKLAQASGVRVAGSLGKPVREDELAAVLRASPAAASPRRSEPALPVTADDIRSALDAGHIKPGFQPKISLESGLPVGVEALARWHSPRLGLVAPDIFVPVSEAGGQTPALTESMLAQSLAACARWRRHHPDLTVAVNVPPSVIGPALAESVMRLLDRQGLPPASLVLEITENRLVSDSLETAELLTRLRIEGAQLSIDDFGTGYSSLVSLLRIPFNEIKLDRLFVSNALRDPDADRILRAVVAMSHEMGLRCVAEGIDSVELGQRMSRYGCDVGQGWLWAGATSEDELAAWLDAPDWRAASSRDAMACESKI